MVVEAVRLLKRLGDAFDDWQGQPARPGVPERPGVMRRLEMIESELHPNGGSSLRDAINRTGKRSERNEE